MLISSQPPGRVMSIMTGSSGAPEHLGGTLHALVAGKGGLPGESDKLERNLLAG